MVIISDYTMWHCVCVFFFLTDIVLRVLEHFNHVANSIKWQFKWNEMKCHSDGQCVTHPGSVAVIFEQAMCYINQTEVKKKIKNISSHLLTVHRTHTDKTWQHENNAFGRYRKHCVAVTILLRSAAKLAAGLGGVKVFSGNSKYNFMYNC